MPDNDPNTPPTPSGADDASNVVSLTPVPAESTPSEKVISFVKRHPVLTVAGGLAAGVAISALLPRKAGRKLAGRAVNLAEATGAAAMMFGRETSGKVQSLGHEARHRAEDIAARAEKAGGLTAAQLEKYGLAAIAAASTLARGAMKRAETVSHAAADKGHQIADKAGELKQRIRH
jgi:hypothetical protein